MNKSDISQQDRSQYDIDNLEGKVNSSEHSDLFWKFNNLNSKAKIILGREINGHKVPHIPIKELSEGAKWQQSESTSPIANSSQALKSIQESKAECEKEYPEIFTEREIKSQPKMSKKADSAKKIRLQYRVDEEIQRQYASHTPEIKPGSETEIIEEPAAPIPPLMPVAPVSNIKVNYEKREELPYVAPVNINEGNKSNNALGKTLLVTGVVALLGFVGWNYLSDIYETVSTDQLNPSTYNSQSLTDNDDVSDEIMPETLSEYLDTFEEREAQSLSNIEQQALESDLSGRDSSYQPQYNGLKKSISKENLPQYRFEPNKASSTANKPNIKPAAPIPPKSETIASSSRAKTKVTKPKAYVRTPYAPVTRSASAPYQKNYNVPVNTAEVSEPAVFTQTPGVDPAKTYISGLNQSIPDLVYSARTFPVELSPVTSGELYNAVMSSSLSTLEMNEERPSTEPVWKSPYRQVSSTQDYNSQANTSDPYSYQPANQVSSEFRSEMSKHREEVARIKQNLRELGQ